jgi:hypothetical protein
MTRIVDLTAAQLARHAFNVFLFEGRHLVGARLIYHALLLEPYEPDALRCLSDILDNDGTEALSAVVLEYALAPESPISAVAREELDDLRFVAKWGWSFSKHKEGLTAVGWEHLHDRSQFIVDEEGYQALVESYASYAGSLEKAFQGAHTLSGVMGGLLTHKELGAKSGMEDIIYPERFERTPLYDDWLQSDTEEFDALEAARENHSGGNP